MDDNSQNETFQKFGMMVFRWLLIYIGGRLVEHGILTQAALDSLTTPSMVTALFGLSILGFITYRGWFRAKFNVLFPKAAHQADPDMPLEDVKAEVKKQL